MTKKHFSISIFGANGRIGRALVCMLSQRMPWLGLNLVVRDENTLAGLKSDVESVTPRSSIRVFNYSNYNICSDLSVVVAGTLPSHELKMSFIDVDPSGRFVQAVANRALALSIGGVIKRTHADTPTLIVTNQSDILAGLLRLELDLDNVYGFGNMLDSRRFRVASGDLSAHVIGYHSDEMMLMHAPENKGGDEALLDIVKSAGMQISESYGPSSRREQHGAVFGPAICLSETIEAYFDNAAALVESYNHCPSYMDFIGPLGIGMPIRIGGGAIQQSDFGRHLSQSDCEQIYRKYLQVNSIFEHVIKQI